MAKAIPVSMAIVKDCGMKRRLSHWRWIETWTRTWLEFPLEQTATLEKILLLQWIVINKKERNPKRQDCEARYEESSNKDCQPMKLEQKHQILLKLSIRELCDSNLSGLHTFDNIHGFFDRVLTRPYRGL